MHALARVQPGCEIDPDFNGAMCGFYDSEYLGNGEPCIPINGCGTGSSFGFFVTFSLCVSFVFVNLFMAVLIEGYETSVAIEKEVAEQQDHTKVGLTEAQYTMFCKQWVKHDQDLEYRISQSQICSLLYHLSKPMGFGIAKMPAHLRPTHEEVAARVARLKIRSHREADDQYGSEAFYLFEDVVSSLSGRAMHQHLKRTGSEIFKEGAARKASFQQQELRKQFVDKSEKHKQVVRAGAGNQNNRRIIL